MEKSPRHVKSTLSLKQIRPLLGCFENTLSVCFPGYNDEQAELEHQQRLLQANLN